MCTFLNITWNYKHGKTEKQRQGRIDVNKKAESVAGDEPLACGSSNPQTKTSYKRIRNQKEYSSDKHVTSCIPPRLAQGSQCF